MDRVWWENVLRVLARPRAVFAAMRDDDDEAADSRVDPINAIVGLAAISAVSWAPQTGRFFSDPEIDGLLVAVILVVSGAFYGFFGYFLFGALTRVGLATVGLTGADKRLVRHVAAYSAVPVAASIVLLPVRLALYGGAIFERGAESGQEAVAVAFLATVAWSVALLALGLRVVFALDWRRAVAAVLLPAFLPTVIVVGLLT